MILKKYSYQRQTSMSTTGFEPAISASERQQIYAFDRTAIEIGRIIFWLHSIFRDLRCRCMQKRKYIFMQIL